MNIKDNGGRLCKQCGPQLSYLPGASTKPLNSNLSRGPTMLSVEEQSKLIEALNLDPDEWSFGYEVKFIKGKFTFNILLKNKLDATKNVRALAGHIG